ncbi:protein FAR1-RELATED SEQUENCE 5-like [Argentina anserina]|uniref:protein FAR1-RELATED SEQUENCE 5-like n=1 Tax=Argentina anserina TaxID=57926 RepID=UPI0021768F56|nr:protein FAR1-RELATED SEQUENCE 5-like [Potentilla anserina]XP_050387983.1 protein FAR1-RELATED SEQUENCE 5-like [Potentilla anserina]XP_050387984.1 protein FAR1-RELATED SEQUENCE 5-like [Potentilla anserina]XP_050387985.1 protein FAR1-RELATED SEQUENCE 5-like [Potentilla anserina]XP_050387986.1 protein FAR1-RELATED SEQUENCE 5-like [Potentilla anserina]XP_050387987.1 protein FAR1-RELATED SEQUENCE 5-like [Potentilla anserina]
MPSAEVLAAIAKWREAQAKKDREVELEEDAEIFTKRPQHDVVDEVDSNIEDESFEKMLEEDLDEPEQEVTHNSSQYNGIKYDKLLSEDLIGVEFVTIEEAEDFYYAYAKSMGFDVRRDDKRTSSRTGRITIRSWVCSAEGQRRQNNMDNRKRVRMPKKLTRFGCPCMFKIRFLKDKNSYVVVKFRTNHSHGLVPPHQTHLLRSHRHVPDSQLDLAKSMQSVPIRTCHSFQHMSDVAGGFSKVGFTIKDLYNKLDSSKRKSIIGGDAKATLAYLEGKAVEDKNLFFKYTTDANKRLANLFWRDSTSFQDYCCFGDVLVFDSTYLTNHYGKPLVLFVGSNNHLSTVIFGFALLEDETAKTYKWVLEMFLESMNDRKPRAVLTDGAESMRKAIELVLPGCPHRLCTWHISKNAQKNLRKPEVLAEFRRCMFDEITPSNFEQRWRNMVDKHQLQKRKWVNMMYANRHKWAEAFVSGHFFARMRSTQRCEGMNRYVKTNLRYSGVRLIELLHQLDKALERLRNKNLHEDFRSNNSTHVLSSRIQQLEKHASSIYTDNVFQVICEEIDRVAGLITSKIMHMKSCRVYVTSGYNHDIIKECTTIYHFQKSEVVCSCKLFECEGIPCSHIFNVMKYERMKEIHVSLVLKRWTKRAKSDVHFSLTKENIPSEVSPLARHGDLSYLGSKVSYLASQTEEGTDIMKKELYRLKPILTDVLKQQTDASNSSYMCNDMVRDPIKVRNKGMSKQPKTRSKCGLCRSFGHNRTICPQKSRLRGKVRVVNRDYTQKQVDEFPAKKKPKLRRLSDIKD